MPLPVFTREQLIASFLYWGVWVFVLFVVPEILGWERIAPWVTLSETVDVVEKGRQFLSDAIFFFVIGVAVHWRFQTPFGRTEAVALALAVVTRLIAWA